MESIERREARGETREARRERRETVRGIIFDYGGTLDSRGVHWSEVIWQGYCHAGIDRVVTKEQFREAYVHAERELARVRHILPGDNFLDLMRKKVAIEAQALHGAVPACAGALDSHAVEDIAQYCYQQARACIDEARPVLETLAQSYPMMLVSNFYGNVGSVLHDMGIRHLFKGVIESAVVGVRKPNPTLFRLGVDALELPAEHVLVVGDSLTKDIEPAEQLGCQVLWLKGQGWTSDEDALTHPNTITSITQVPETLQSSQTP
ncbi:MAG: HAD family hydrolase [Muribaculaceae bacterium]|nr:HAD family hydrolase [Muribaculaceae bacterium]